MKNNLLFTLCIALMYLLPDTAMAYTSANYNSISDIEITGLRNQDIMINDSLAINFSLKNGGSNTVNSVVVEWREEGSFRGGTQKFDNIDLKRGTIKEFTFANKYKPVNEGENKIVLKVITVNNEVYNQRSTSDTNYMYVESIRNAVEKNVLIEEATGAWCGHCVDGAWYLKRILQKHKKIIGVALHSGDKMETANTRAACNAMAKGYPSGFVNRTAYNGETGLSRSVWESKSVSQLGQPTTIAINVIPTYNKTTRKLSAKVDVDFTAQKTGNFRVNLYIVENNVTGKGYGWDQSSYYNDVPGHPAYGLGSKIVGYVHNHVVRKMAGGTWGTDGIIPNVANGKYSHTYNVDIKNEWKDKDIHVVAVVSEHGSNTTQRRIFNAIEKPLVAAAPTTTSIELYKGANKIDITKPVVINGKATDSELKYAFNIKNISSKDVEVKLVRETVSATKGHNFYFCWKDCYQPNVAQSSAMTITKGSTHTDEISLHLEPNSTKGLSKYKIKFLNTKDANDKIEVEVHFNVTDNSSSAKSIELYKGANKIDITKPVVINGKATDSELKYAFNIKNISSKDVEVKLVRETVSNTKGHNFYFCWKDCYQPNVTQSSAMTIAKGATHADEVSLHLEPNSTKGLSKYKIKFVNTKDANDKIEIEVHFNVTDNSSSAKSIELYKGANKIDITKPVVINGKATDSELKYAFNIKNISSKDVEVKLVRETVSNTKGHNFYFCWKDCYQPNAAQSSAMTIAKGATHADEISLHLEPNSTKGLSKYKIKFVNTKDANDNIEVEVHFNVTEKSTSGSSIELYNGSDKIDITKPIIINGKATDTELKYTFNVKNISSADVDVILSREAVSAVKEHSFYFCWKDCYLPNITESNAMTITKGSTHADEVSLHLEPKSIEGVSTYKITIKNRDKINDKAEFTVKFNVTGTSTNITSAEGKGIRVYPNPVVDNLMLNGKIDNSNAEPVIFRLYSIEGKLIKHIQLNGYINHMNNSINCSDVPSGIYTYTVSTTDKIYSGRIVKR